MRLWRPPLLHTSADAHLTCSCQAVTSALQFGRWRQKGGSMQGLGTRRRRIGHENTTLVFLLACWGLSTHCSPVPCAKQNDKGTCTSCTAPAYLASGNCYCPLGNFPGTVCGTPVAPGLPDIGLVPVDAGSTDAVLDIAADVSVPSCPPYNGDPAGVCATLPCGTQVGAFACTNLTSDPTCWTKCTYLKQKALRHHRRESRAIPGHGQRCQGRHRCGGGWMPWPP